MIIAIVFLLILVLVILVVVLVLVLVHTIAGDSLTSLDELLEWGWAS